MNGFNGEILRVDLSQGATWTERPSAEFYRACIGGRGIIVEMLLKEVPCGADPLGPNNRLIFALGPFTGYLPGGGRNSVGAKSPLTGRFGESEAGGYWGSELKRAGFDAIVIQGRAPSPVWLSIADGQAELRDATSLWGLEIAPADQAIRDLLPGRRYRTAVIGPAGERQISFATIANDITHVYGRTGMGAVMGSKNLKAVAVSGHRLPPLADKERLVALSRWMAKNFKNAPFWVCGTGASMVRYEETGNLPIRNFSARRFPGVTRIQAQTMCDTGMLVGMHSCFGCPMRCKKKVESGPPWPVDPIYGGPEYETLAAFGSNCGIDNLPAILKAHELCNRYGIDTISAGGCIAFAMECFEKGFIDRSDTGGIELVFGNVDAMLELVKQIASCTGFGELLAGGVRRASERIGPHTAELAMQVGGLELSMHDPRHNLGMALHYSMHVTGGDHCPGTFDDIDRTRLERWTPKGAPALDDVPVKELSARKAYFLYRVGAYRQACNHLGLCQFLPWNFQQILEALQAITGWHFSFEQFMEAIARGITLARVFNLRETGRPQEDSLPQRFFRATGEDPAGRDPIDPTALKTAQEAYYALMGWGPDGVPTLECLSRLGVDWAASYLSDLAKPASQDARDEMK